MNTTGSVLVGAAILLLMNAPSIGAQGLPAVMPPVVTGTLAGVVRDTAAQPIPAVQVSIPTLDRGIATDSAGNFSLSRVPAGEHEVWLRRLGYVVVQFTWSARADERLEVAIAMRPLPAVLDPVIVWAGDERDMKSTSIVRGLVVDGRGFPVEGADVQLIGTGRGTVTASDGSFQFRHTRTGSLSLRVRSLGSSPSVVRFRLDENDERQLVIRMTALATTLDTVRVREQSGYGGASVAWSELDRRQRWQREGSAFTLDAQRLAALGGTPLDLALHPLAKGGAAGDACILENGWRPLRRPLRAYTASDVEMVEYFPKPSKGGESDVTGTVTSRMNINGCFGSFGDHPDYYVLWLRGSR